MFIFDVFVIKLLNSVEIHLLNDVNLIVCFISTLNFHSFVINKESTHCKNETRSQFLIHGHSEFHFPPACHVQASIQINLTAFA